MNDKTCSGYKHDYHRFTIISGLISTSQSQAKISLLQESYPKVAGEEFKTSGGT